jgi:hypothetical protein
LLFTAPHNCAYAKASLRQIQEWQNVHSLEDLDRAKIKDMTKRFLSLNNLGLHFNEDYIDNMIKKGQPATIAEITLKKNGETLSEMKARFLSCLGLEASHPCTPVKVKRVRENDENECHPSSEHKKMRPRSSASPFQATISSSPASANSLFLDGIEGDSNNVAMMEILSSINEN